MTGEAFWKRKQLRELSQEEWEALCDGCGKCCVVKLEDADTGNIFYTDVACALLDQKACNCTDYRNRQARMADCVTLTPHNIDQVKGWMPTSCAYRLLAEGGDLPDWHHLVCGDRQAVHRTGNSVRGRTSAETDVPEDELPAHIVDWL